MTETEHDVVGIGNAIVDLIAQIEDSFLEEKRLTKGTMTIIDATTAEILQRSLGTTTEISGGSAANTVAGIAALGGRGAFIGKVGDDKLGDVFRLDMNHIGVNIFVKSRNTHTPTARSFIFVTPDAERTMQTYLGACVELKPKDIDSDLIAKSTLIYLEGYLWDPPEAKKALIKAAKVAKKVGRKTSLSLSDSFCVKRHRIEFIEFINRYVHILFANEEEIKSLYLVETFEEAVQKIRSHCDIAVLTRGSMGSSVISGGNIYNIDAHPVKKVVDTTGAGDAYAAGFLYGYTQGKNLITSAQIGGIIAAEVIGHYGARAETSLPQLLKKHLAGKL